jgi:hypothetical protein
MKNTKEQIKEIFTKHFPEYSNKLNFIDKLGCDRGMCKKFNDNRKFIYQFLPVPIPKSPVEYIFICKEPSTPWAKGTTDAYDKVLKKQYMNFVSVDPKNKRLDIMIAAFRKVFGAKSILITDMSKCALDTNIADKFGFKENLEHRYNCCAPYLYWEFKNLTVSNPNIFIVGKNYFFIEWYKRKYQSDYSGGESDVLYFKKFLDDEVKINIDTNKVSMLPHYSIRFSCPEYILKMLKIDTAEIEIEINSGLKDLYKYYLYHFILTKNLENSIDHEFSDMNLVKSKEGYSDSLILLYMLYKNEFETAKEKWIHREL